MRTILRATNRTFISCAMFALLAGCAATGDREFNGDEASSEDGLWSSTVSILGSMQYGEERDDVAYVARPRYLGYTFEAQTGDAVHIDVTAAGEDAYSWLIDESRHVIANDSILRGPPDTHAAHLDATIPRDGTYTIVFREAHWEHTRFTVGLDGTRACSAKRCSDVGATCGTIEDGCGHSLDCGTCSGGATCGGGGQANVCGSPPPPPPCTWARNYEQAYGQAWNPSDVGFVTSDGALHRGMGSLNLEASRNAVPDNVYTQGSNARVTELRLFQSGGANVLASRSGTAIYGLGDAMWHQVNGYAGGDLVELTLIRLFTEPVHSYSELKEYFRKLTANSVSLVPAGDQADYSVAAAQLMSKVDSGQLTFKLGTGHAIDFPQTGQYVNGKTFSFQFSDALGLDPKIGIQKGSAYTFWPSIPVDPVCR